ERKLASPSPFVFPSRHDPKKPLGSFKTAWNALKRRTGIKGRLRFHDCRHAYLSEAARQIKAKTSDYSAVEICVFAGLSLEVFMKVYRILQPEDLIQLTNVCAAKLRIAE